MSDAPMTIIQLFNAYRTNLGYGFVAALLCVLRAWHDGKEIKQFAFDAAACAMLAGGADQLIELLGLPAKYGYFAAVFIGVFGWQIIVSRLKNNFPSESEAKSAMKGTDTK